MSGVAPKALARPLCMREWGWSVPARLVRKSAPVAQLSTVSVCSTWTCVEMEALALQTFFLVSWLMTFSWLSCAALPFGRLLFPFSGFHFHRIFGKPSKPMLCMWWETTYKNVSHQNRWESTLATVGSLIFWLTKKMGNEIGHLGGLQELSL